MAEVRFLRRLDAAPNMKTQIFNLERPEASEKAVRGFAEALGFDAKRGRLSQDPIAYSYEDGPHLLTLYGASGGLRYQDQTRWQRDDGKSTVEIPDDEATKLALAVVAKYQLAPPEECSVLKVTRLNVGSADIEGQSASERAIDVGVAFQRMIDGVPVDGPGGKVIVYLDHKGEMTGFDRIWRTLKGGKPVEALKEPRAAEESLERHWKDHSGLIEVRDQRFGYFELGFQDEQPILQPAYILLLTLISEERRVTMNTVHVVEAATNAVGRLMPRHKKPLEQEPRRD